MKISRSNYEVYFLDYIDGNLPVGQVDEFLDFLANNPDLAEELKAVSELSLPAEHVIYQEKESLLKHDLSINSNFDYRAVAFIEGDLPEPEQSLFLEEIKKEPAKQKSVDLMRNLRLKPNSNIHFPNKKELTKKDKRVLIIWMERIAAILILAFAIWAIFTTGKQKTEPEKQLVKIEKNQTEPQPGKAITNQITEKEPEKPILVNQEEKASTPSKTIKKPEQNIETPVGNAIAFAERETIPARLIPLDASLQAKTETGQIALQNMNNKQNKAPDYVKLDQYLAQKILNSPKGESFTFSNLAKAGLQAAENISNDRLNVATNVQGKISEITFHSRLLAFSIPVRRNK